MIRRPPSSIFSLPSESSHVAADLAHPVPLWPNALTHKPSGAFHNDYYYYYVSKLSRLIRISNRISKIPPGLSDTALSSIADLIKLMNAGEYAYRLVSALDESY